MMVCLKDCRANRSDFYSDQAVYTEFAARRFGLTFVSLDDESGLAFVVHSTSRQAVFGGGRCSFYPQNSATSATLSADKYLTALVLDAAGVPNLGGDYFFLDDRHRALRAPGHERDDAIAYFMALGGAAFVKPLSGSRGDYALAISDQADLHQYIDAVARHYDSVIMQRVVAGDEYRLFVLDDTVLYTARKNAPAVVGDGVSTLYHLMAARDRALVGRGISGLALNDDLDVVLPAGERHIIVGRTNRSAGGDMAFADPPAGAADLAIRAVGALGLRAGGVDLFTGLDGDTPMRVIEINANPSIRFLEDSGRDDLILAIWRHTFTAMGLLDV